MHAILGLAASELLPTDSNLLHAALHHRLLSLRAIKRKLASFAPPSAQAPLITPTTTACPSSSPLPISHEEGNALLATCFALTFQSVHLDDGMAEFMTFVRGVVMVAIKMAFSQVGFLFVNFIGKDQEVVLRPYLDSAVVPAEMEVWREDAVGALERLRCLCEGDHLKVKYWERTLGIARKLEEGAFEAWKGISQHYEWWMLLPHADFARIVDPEDRVFMLLASHCEPSLSIASFHVHYRPEITVCLDVGIAIKQIMASITDAERVVSPHSQDRTNDVEGGMARWLNKHIQPPFETYNQWPRWVEARLDEDSDFFRKTKHDA